MTDTTSTTTTARKADDRASAPSATPSSASSSAPESARRPDEPADAGTDKAGAEPKPVRIRLDNISKVFGRDEKAALAALRDGQGKREVQKKFDAVVGAFDVSFEVRQGEIFVLMGLSGSGKSTVLRLVNRLHELSEGRVYIDDDDLTALRGKALRAVRRQKFGMVFQSFALLPHRTVLSNVAFGLEIQGVGRAERERRAQEVVNTVGLTGYENSFARQLSGGMQQRVGLARALCADPEILLMDEAFSALDPLIRSQLQDDLLSIQERLNKTIVFVSHDLDEAMKIGSRIAIMRDGRVIQIGTPAEIISDPADDYVAAFVRGADRRQVLMAQHIMSPSRAIAKPEDKPADLLKRMEDESLEGLLVLDENSHFIGYASLGLVVKHREAERLDRDVLKPLPTVNIEAGVGEMTRRITREGAPLVVLDPDQRVVGEIGTTTLLNALAQQDDEEEESGDAADKQADKDTGDDADSDSGAEKTGEKAGEKAGDKSGDGKQTGHEDRAAAGRKAS